MKRNKKPIPKTARKAKPPTLRIKSGGTRKLPKIRPRLKHKKASKKVALKTQPRSRVISRKRSRRVMLIFSEGKTIHAKVSRKTASAIGQYLNAVDEFLKSNDPEHLKPFVGVSIKDGARKSHMFETRPNTLYRLNAGIEPFEEIYRILA